MTRTGSAIAATFAAGLSLGTAPSAAQELRVELYVQLVTPSEAWVLWELGDDGGGDAVLWGPDQGLGSEAAGSTVEGGIREAHLSGLQPDTRYHYLVGDSEGVFRTPSADREAGFVFAAVADMQQDSGNPQIWGEIAEQGISAVVTAEYGPELDDELALVLVAGDLVHSGWEQDQWRDEFFAPAANLTSRVPLYPVLGNHEANTEHYFQYFHLPENGGEGLEERFWFLDRANTRIIGLDSNFPFASEAQLQWLEGVLDEACVDDDLDFAVSQLHHPFRSEVGPPGWRLPGLTYQATSSV